MFACFIFLKLTSSLTRNLWILPLYCSARPWITGKQLLLGWDHLPRCLHPILRALWTTGDKQSLLHPSTHGCLGAQVSTLIQSSAPALPSEIHNAWRTLKINLVDYISVLHPCNVFRSITVGWTSNSSIGETTKHIKLLHVFSFESLTKSWAKCVYLSLIVFLSRTIFVYMILTNALPVNSSARRWCLYLHQF